ncbi:histone deacetylase family protein [Mangrovimicrobium sediminis]|uniref:Histone deacetylase family protein n=1 Tax=Mangrovimicrobium sediminis TaxID=2562682 RepID=A0A4Z0LWR2_9GAMM|nr:histone deacetylase family protein [Haliea sp. SAOS-164]TGD71505.1 histone deacetylase family protein [Haliea sp. SAOS-164]
MSITYITHPTCLLHDMGRGHPEQPARLAAIDARLRDSDIAGHLRRVEAQPASDALIIAAHSAQHLAQMVAAAPATGIAILDADTRMNPHSLAAARLAAGAAVQGVDLLMTGATRRVFCAVRPPGHHAEREQAMGFCLFNNVAIAALHALEQHGLERVAIVDFDVHHGNGTQDIVAGDPRILFCSSFQHPWYPFSGAGESADNILNTPLPAGCSGAQLRAAVETEWLPHLARFAPQLLIVSAGFDAHRADPLAEFELDEDDFAWLTRRVCEQAARSARGRVLSSLEGGYALDALGSSVEAHLRAMLED